MSHRQGTPQDTQSQDSGRGGVGALLRSAVRRRVRRREPAEARPPLVAVVTDSTAALTAEQVDEWGVTVVPLDVAAAGVRYRDGIDLDPAGLVSLLTAGTRVTTSQPAPAAFVEAYQRLADSGVQEVVSVHLSGHLSGTVRAAGLAAQVAPMPVHVVDTHSAGLGVGFAALAAVRAAQRGCTGPEVATEAERVGWSSDAWFLVDSVDHLRRGGRISAPAAALATVLGLRPVLTLADGRIDVAERVRTRPAARERLLQLAVAEAATRDHPIRLAVHHLDRPQAAALLADELHAVPGVVEVRVAEVSAVLGGHLGVGAMAVVLADA